MKKIVVLFGVALCSGLASAQWAVLDESVRLIGGGKWGQVLPFASA